MRRVCGRRRDKGQKCWAWEACIQIKLHLTLFSCIEGRYRQSILVGVSPSHVGALSLTPISSYPALVSACFYPSRSTHYFSPTLFFLLIVMVVRGSRGPVWTHTHFSAFEELLGNLNMGVMFTAILGSLSTTTGSEPEVCAAFVSP